MTWQLSGKSVELCSCNVLCPCWIGPDGPPDKGWCSGAFAFDVRKGSSDGVDLSNTKTVIAAEWPGNFFGGNGTLRVYVDASATPEQQRELGAIFAGNKGGHLGGLFGAVFSKHLPVRTEKIDITWGDNPKFSVGSIGTATLQPIKDQSGKPTRVTGSMAQAGFQIDSMDLASAKGTRWADPEMRAWEADSGTLHEFDWRA